MTPKTLTAALFIFILFSLNPHSANAQAGSTFETRAAALLSYTATLTNTNNSVRANYAIARYARNTDIATANTMIDATATNLLTTINTTGSYFHAFPVMIAYIRYNQLMSQALRDKVTTVLQTYDAVADMGGAPIAQSGGGTSNQRYTKMALGLLAAEMWPTAPHMATQFTASKAWLMLNLHEMATRGYNEQDSPTYASVHMQAIGALAEYAQDTQVKKLATMTMDWLMAGTAAEWIDGYWIATSRRDYHGMTSPKLSTSGGIAGWLFFGGDEQPSFIRSLAELDDGPIILASSLIYRPHSIIQRISQVAQRPASYTHRERRIPLPNNQATSQPTNQLSYITPTYGVGSQFLGLLAEDTQSWLNQARRWLVRWKSTNAVSTFWLTNNQYGESWQNPLSTQYEQTLQKDGVIVSVFNIPTNSLTSFIEGPYSKGIVSTIQDPSGWLFAHAGSMLMGIRTAGTRTFVADRTPLPEREQDVITGWMQSAGRKNAVIVETSPVTPYAGGGAAAELQRYATAIVNGTTVNFSQVSATSPRVTYTSLAGDVLDITYNGAKTINGVARVGSDAYPTLDDPFMHQDYGDETLVINQGGEEWTWDFAALTVTQTSASDTVPPSTPTNLSASAISANQVNLSWSASTDNVGVTGYSLERCTGPACSTFLPIATPTGTSYNDPGLTPETTYRYRVRATDAAANFSGYSTTVDAVTPATGGGGVSNPVAWWALDETTGTIAVDSVGAKNASLINGPTWTTGRIGNALSLDGVNDHALVGDNAAFDPGTGSFTLSAWVYTGGSVDAYGQGIVAKETSGGTDRYYLSIMPSGQLGGLFRVDGTNAFEASFGGAVLPLDTWRHVAITFDRNGVATGYVNGVAEPTTRSLTSRNGLVFDNTNALTIGARIQGAAGFFTGRIDDVRYYDSVLSVADIQELANPAAVPDTTPPTIPTGLTTTSTSETAIALTWNASTDDVGVTGYRLERCTGAVCSDFSQIITQAGTTYNDTGLAVNTPYRYRVRAADAAGNISAYSTILQTSTTADTTVPSTPANLAAAVVSANQINLAWNASTDNIGVTGYRLERCTGSACATFVEIATPATTAYADSFLTASTLYRYRVRATDAAGNFSPYSAIAQDTTQAEPPPPTPIIGTPIAHWRMDELGGIYAADNVGGRTATLLNGPTWTAGRIGSAIFFDGVNDHLALTDSASTTLNPPGDFTLTAWVYPDPAKGGTIIAKESSGSPDRFYVSLSPSRVLQAAFVVDGVTAFEANFGGAALTPNVWSHIAVTFNRNGNAIGYVNGIAQPTSRPINTLGTLTFSNSDLFTIGAGGQGTTDFFLGRIDDVRMYATELPVTDILAIYTEHVLCE